MVIDTSPLLVNLISLETRVMNANVVGFLNVPLPRLVERTTTIVTTVSSEDSEPLVTSEKVGAYKANGRLVIATTSSTRYY